MSPEDLGKSLDEITTHKARLAKDETIKSLIEILMKEGLHEEHVYVTHAMCRGCGPIKFAFVMGREGEGFNRALSVLHRTLKGEKFSIQELTDLLRVSTDEKPEKLGIKVMSFKEFREIAEKMGITNAIEALADVGIKGLDDYIEEKLKHSELNIDEAFLANAAKLMSDEHLMRAKEKLKKRHRIDIDD